MKFVLKLADRQIFYDEQHIFIEGNMCATYSNTHVVWIPNNSTLAELKHYVDHSWTLVKTFENGILEAHDRDKTLRNLYYNKVLGTYTGSHAGALASYIAYKHYLIVGGLPKTCTQLSNIQHKQTSNAKNKIPEPLKAVEPPKVTHEQEQKYIPPKYETPKIEKLYEAPHIYELPKQEEEYEKLNLTLPPAPIPSGNCEENTGCIGPIAGLAIAVLVLVIAIKLIPQSWKDLGPYIAKGDVGIIICFFSSLIGGILAIFKCIYEKECKLSSSLSAFLITCVIGIVINIIILFKDIIAGEHEFTGFILFDLPLAIFAPLLGCFQFAFPIGIGVIIICGIICLIKKKT